MMGTGTFAEYVTLPQEAAIKIDDDVPFDIASLIGCGVSTGVGAAINTAKVQPGSKVVVFGCGGVGISVIQGAKVAGASVIVGAFGSGLHGAIFSGPGTRVASLGFHNLTQSMIADFRQQTVAYMTWEGDGPVGDFRVDEERFRRFLAAVVA